MTRLPSPYPHQVVADWIAANDDNALPHAHSVVRTPRSDAQVDDPSPVDYDVAMRHARKAQAKAIVAVGWTIGTTIGRIISNTIGSLRDYFRIRRQIQRLSYFSPRLLDDMGIPHELQIRVRAKQAQRQPLRIHLHF